MTSKFIINHTSFHLSIVDVFCHARSGRLLEEARPTPPAATCGMMSLQCHGGGGAHNVPHKG